MRGRLISLEGGEGAGKSSALAAVVGVLSDAGIEALSTREPGGSELAEAIRKILLDPRHATIPPLSELLLLFAARADHLDKVITPALDAGRWVICDRFIDASYAYQGGGRGLDWQKIATLEDWIMAGRQPDLTLLLDVNPTVGLARALQGRRADRFEREQRAFHVRVRDAYLERGRGDPQRVKIVDAGRAQALVIEDIVAVVNARVAQWKR